MQAIPRHSPEDLAALAEHGTATIHEALGRRGELDPAIGPLWPGARVVGTAFPVECAAQDNLMIHHALSCAARGDVLVVSTSGAWNAGYWGLITTRCAVARGLAGLVIDGCVRDSAAIEEQGFPVFCRGRSIRGTTKTGLGRAGAPIEVGGQTVAPGDLVIGDRDGVVVVPGNRVLAVLEAARQREKKERDFLAEIDRGRLTVDLLGLRSVLERGGLA